MTTDKEFYKLFSSAPEMLFGIADIKINCKYTMKSITLKEIERRADGFLEPEVLTEPVYFVEFQAYKDESIYHRIVTEMGSFAGNNLKRQICGMIIFFEKSFDTKTKPWYCMSLIADSGFRVLYLKEILATLEQKNPNHPLVLVFKPYMIANDNEVKAKSKDWYAGLENTDLPKEQKETFELIFIHWLMERFKNMTYEEVRKMAGIMTPLEETRAYKELVAEGEKNEKKAIAKNMIKKGYDTDAISEVTGLTVDEVKRLK